MNYANVFLQYVCKHFTKLQKLYRKLWKKYINQIYYIKCLRPGLVK